MEEKIVYNPTEDPNVINVGDALPKGEAGKEGEKAKPSEEAQKAEKEKAKIKAEKRAKRKEAEAKKLKRLEKIAAKELRKAERKKLAKFRKITMSRTTMQITIPVDVREKALKACGETAKSIKPSGKMTTTTWDPKNAAMVTRIVTPE